MEYLYLGVGAYVLWMLANISIQQREQTRAITEGITSLKDGLEIPGGYGESSVEDMRRSLEAIKDALTDLTEEHSIKSDLVDIKNALEDMRISLKAIHHKTLG
jgi:hypothetical protein